MAGSEGKSESAPVKDGNKCGFCPSKVSKSGVICKICKTNYHNSCGKKVKVCCSVNLVNFEDGDESSVSGLKVSSHSYPPSLNSVADTCEYHRMEVGLLRSLLVEKDNRILDLLKINQLLEERIKNTENIKGNKNSKLLEQKMSTDKGSRTFLDATKTIIDKEDKQTKSDNLINKKNDQNNKGYVNKQIQHPFTIEQTGKLLQNINKKVLETKQQNIMNEIIHLEKPETAEFKQVNRRKKNKNQKTGTAEAAENEECFQMFQARNYKKPEERKLWLHISRVKSTVGEQTVRDYISKKGNLGVDDISVKLLKTRSEVRDNNCFMIGVPLRMKELIYDSEFWPKGVKFQRFDFRIGQHFLSAETGNEMTT